MNFTQSVGHNPLKKHLYKKCLIIKLYFIPTQIMNNKKIDKYTSNVYFSPTQINYKLINIDINHRLKDKFAWKTTQVLRVTIYSSTNYYL